MAKNRDEHHFFQKTKTNKQKGGSIHTKSVFWAPGVEGSVTRVAVHGTPSSVGWAGLFSELRRVTLCGLSYMSVPLTHPFPPFNISNAYVYPLICIYEFVFL